MLGNAVRGVRGAVFWGGAAALMAGLGGLGCGDDSTDDPSAAGGGDTGGTAGASGGGGPGGSGGGAGTGGDTAGSGGGGAGTGAAAGTGTGGEAAGGTGGSGGSGGGTTGTPDDFAWGDEFLRTQGDLIVDGSGTPIHLTGFGIGGWHLMEGYMIGNPGPCPGNRGDNPYCRTDRYIRQHIVDKIGEERAAELFRQYIDNYFSANEMAQLAAWGFNMMRLPLNANQIMLDDAPNGPPYTYLAEGFRALDNVVEWATQNGVYLIFDMHAAPGAQIGHNIADALFEGPIDGVPGETICGLDRLWDEPDVFWPRNIDLWLTLARRYGQTPTVIGYEFLNEPMVPGVEQECEPEGGRSSNPNWAEHDNSPLLDLYQQITQALRDAGDRKIHFAEAAFWGMNFIGMQTPWDDNMVYAWHFYPIPQDDGWLSGGTTGASFGPILSQDIPLWHSETGGSSNTGEIGTWVNWMRVANSGNPMAWSWWTHKKSSSNTSQPWTCPRPATYEALLDNWDGTSAADAEVALFDWVDSLRTENCSVNGDVVTALGGTL